MSYYFNIDRYTMQNICDDFELAQAYDDDEIYEISELTYIDSDDIYVRDTYDYHYCDCCGRWVSDDYWNYRQEVCDECEEDNIIQSYHNGHSDGVMFFDVDGGAPKPSREDDYSIGIELEVECLDASWSELNEHASNIVDIIGYDRVHIEEDCSLIDGFEIITQPHTIEAFNSVLMPKLYEAMEYLKANGFTSEDGGRCGLHIHYGAGFFLQDDTKTFFESQLIAVFRNNFELLANLSRRHKDVSYCHKNRLKDCGGHYDAINTSNYATTEIRLGRGTLNTSSFTAWMDICNTIVSNLKSAGCSRWDVLTNGITDTTRRYIERRTNYSESVTA